MPAGCEFYDTMPDHSMKVGALSIDFHLLVSNTVVHAARGGFDAFSRWVEILAAGANAAPDAPSAS
jgi:hypothetical protein